MSFLHEYIKVYIIILIKTLKDDAQIKIFYAESNELQSRLNDESNKLDNFIFNKNKIFFY